MYKSEIWGSVACNPANREIFCKRRERDFPLRDGFVVEVVLSEIVCSSYSYYYYYYSTFLFFLSFSFF